MKFTADDIGTLQAKAKALKSEGRLDEAIECHRKIYSLTPSDGIALHNFASTLGDKGLFEETIEIAEKALSTGLNAPETWLVYARALLGEQCTEEAEKAYRKAVALRPGDLAAHRELAQIIWMTTADAEKALAPINHVISRTQNNYALRVTRAQLFGEMGDALSELEAAKKAEAYSNGDAFIQYIISLACLETGDSAAALSYAQKAAALCEGVIVVEAALCRALLANGMVEAANERLIALQKAEPRNQGYIALQATAWRMLGDDRYKDLYDYDRFVKSLSLATPKGWSTLDDYLDDLCIALDQRHIFKTHPFKQSVRHGSQISHVHLKKDSVLSALPEAFAAPVEEYLSSVGRDHSSSQLCQRNNGKAEPVAVFSVRLNPGGWHVSHIHPDGWVSSACHLRVPGIEENQSDIDKAGWLHLGEPGFPMQSKLDAEYFVRPKRGRMTFFPSYMWHGTKPARGDETRLAIAADFQPSTI